MQSPSRATQCFSGPVDRPALPSTQRDPVPLVRPVGLRPAIHFLDRPIRPAQRGHRLSPCRARGTLSRHGQSGSSSSACAPTRPSQAKKASATPTPWPVSIALERKKGYACLQEGGMSANVVRSILMSKWTADRPISEDGMNARERGRKKKKGDVSQITP